MKAFLILVNSADTDEMQQSTRLGVSRQYTNG